MLVSVLVACFVVKKRLPCSKGYVGVPVFESEMLYGSVKFVQIPTLTPPAALLFESHDMKQHIRKWTIKYELAHLLYLANIKRYSLRNTKRIVFLTSPNFLPNIHPLTLWKILKLFMSS